MTEYQRTRLHDWTAAVILVLCGLFIFSRSEVYGSPKPWTYDIVEHGDWSVGRVIAACDGENRVYVVRGDTGVAMWVTPGGCDGGAQ